MYTVIINHHFIHMLDESLAAESRACDSHICPKNANIPKKDWLLVSWLVLASTGFGEGASSFKASPFFVPRGGNSNIFYFHPDPWGNDPIWRAYFSNGLKPPTSVACISKNTAWINRPSLENETISKRPGAKTHGRFQRFFSDSGALVFFSVFSWLKQKKTPFLLRGFEYSVVLQIHRKARCLGTQTTCRRDWSIRDF